MLCAHSVRVFCRVGFSGDRVIHNSTQPSRVGRGAQAAQQHPPTDAAHVNAGPNKGKARPMNCTLATLEAVAPAGSRALQDYLRRVYFLDEDATSSRRSELGRGRIAAEREWRWDRVDIVWLEHLPASLRSCEWPRSPTGPNALYLPPKGEELILPTNALWRYGHAFVCRGARMPAWGSEPPIWGACGGAYTNQQAACTGSRGLAIVLR